MEDKEDKAPGDFYLVWREKGRSRSSNTPRLRGSRRSRTGGSPTPRRENLCAQCYGRV
jgi:hypothetical protein